MKPLIYTMMSLQNAPRSMQELIEQSFSSALLMPAFLCSWPLVTAIGLRLAEDAEHFPAGFAPHHAESFVGSDLDRDAA